MISKEIQERTKEEITRGVVKLVGEMFLGRAWGVRLIFKDGYDTIEITKNEIAEFMVERLEQRYEKAILKHDKPSILKSLQK